MLPKYPEFTKLGLEHKDLINDWAKKYEPYSDFNYVSLFSWNVDGSAEISSLNGNLVIRIPDYITEEPIISLLGHNDIETSLGTLLEQPYEIKLIPQATVDALPQEPGFNVVYDPANDDYIYQLQDLADLAGGALKKKRNKLNAFMTKYGDYVSFKHFDLHDKQKALGLKACFDEWAKGRDAADTNVERLAIDRLLADANSFELKCYEVYIGEELVGFSINEVLPFDYAICHFQKAHIHHINLDVYINVMVAKALLEEGCQYVNWEQDLGIAGLRQAKSSYNPAKKLKKYTVSAA